MPRYGWLATLRRLLLIFVGAASGSLGLQMLFPLGYKPIKELVVGFFLLLVGTPLMVFSLERLRQERRSRERLRVEHALQRRQGRHPAEDE